MLFTSFHQKLGSFFICCILESWNTVKTLLISNLIPKWKDGKVKYFLLRLRVSKTDIFRSGVDVPLGDGIGKIDPVNLILHMVSLRKKIAGRSKKLAIRPDNFLFCLENGTPLSRADIRVYLKALVKKCGWDEKRYTSYSFRIGGATSLAKRGIPSYKIQIMGRWRSDCYKTCIRYDHKDIIETQFDMANKQIVDKRKVFLYQNEAVNNAVALN